jgi:hypothetical protein
MTAKEANRKSKLVQKSRLENERAREIAEKVKKQKEADDRLKQELEYAHFRISEAADDGKNIVSYFPGENQYLRNKLIESLINDGYTAYIEWCQYDDDGNGQDTLIIQW